ncbi:MAG TPA: FAD-binding oxidoreductase [Methanomicrobia archaeon]|nr:FAD-binding oxidoreductase [Methanomicrobia archaeon]
MNVKKLKLELNALLGDEARIRTDAFERELYSTDVGSVPFAHRLFETTPQLVVQPQTVDALIKVVRFASAEKVALFPRGAGSSGLGGVVPTKKGIALDLSALNSILELNREQKTITVQTGTRWSAIEAAAQQEGLSLRVYPSSFFSTVGGWIASGGYGIGSFQFGHLKEQIESIEMLFPAGDVRLFTAADKEFALFFGTEGQFGILLAATLRLRKMPEQVLPQLLYFGGVDAALTFVTELIQSKIRPYHIKYLDAHHLKEVNKQMGEALYAERDAVLVALESHDAALPFRQFAKNRGIAADEYLARYLWHERLFPMKRRSTQPTLLACELIMPLRYVAAYLNRARWITKRYGLDLQAEAHMLGETDALVLLSFLSDVRDSWRYLAHLALVPRLTMLGIKQGGAPYNLGIWNAPFITHKLDPQILRAYRAYKRKVDPCTILNPNKFFAVRTRWGVIPDLLFTPSLFRLLIRGASLFTPLMARSGEEHHHESVLEKTLYSCVKCGSCAAQCPAYAVTHDDALIPKNKLYLAKKLHEGGQVSMQEAEKAFLCLHCGLCREVCQNDLDLVAAWEELEQRLELQFGRPDRAIREFVSTAEDSPAYWRCVHAQEV